MEIAPYPNPSGVALEPAANAPARSRPHGHWLLSLTAVCFIFGGLLAMQLRSIEQVRASQVADTNSLRLAQMQAQASKVAAEGYARDRTLALAQLKDLQAQLASTSTLSKQQVAKLNEEIYELQVAAGLTPLAGPGIEVKLNDNPSASKLAGGGALVPGIVHDFDLLQVVNELRAAKAEAIAVNGTRITGFTPIRCVGPAILVNFQTATPPFIIDAIGSPKDLKAAVMLPSGILENLKDQAGLQVDVATVSRLKLPAAMEGVPHLHVATVPAGTGKTAGD